MYGYIIPVGRIMCGEPFGEGARAMVCTRRRVHVEPHRPSPGASTCSQADVICLGQSQDGRTVRTRLLSKRRREGRQANIEVSGMPILESLILGFCLKGEPDDPAHQGRRLAMLQGLGEASYSCCNERPLESQFVAFEEADDEAVDELGMRSQSASGPGSDSPSPEPSASYCDSARHQMVSGSIPGGSGRSAVAIASPYAYHSCPVQILQLEGHQGGPNRTAGSQLAK